MHIMNHMLLHMIGEMEHGYEMDMKWETTKF